MDDNIVGNPDYARELFAKMIPLKKHWFSQCGIRIAYDDELLNLAAASGCSGLFIGFESLSQDNLNAVKNNFNRAKDYIRIVQKVHSVGIAVFAGIAFGMDCDKPSIFEETLNFLYKAKIDLLQATGRLFPEPLSSRKWMHRAEFSTKTGAIMISVISSSRLSI